jgi:hypothetical protein
MDCANVGQDNLERPSSGKLDYRMRKNSVENICNKIILPLFLLAPLVPLSAGCHQDKVQVYQVADDQDQTAQPPAAAPATNPGDSNSTLPPGHPDIPAMGNSSAQMPSGIVAPDTANVPLLTWTTPAGWTEVPPSEMRVASFKVASADGKLADVSVVPLPGMAGGDFANVNRWRGQVGLPAAPDDELQSAAETVQAGGQPAQLYDSAGQSSRILGVIQHRDSTTWFYKMTGDPALVGQQKQAFIAFLQSLNFASPQAAAQLPPGHPAIGDIAAPPANAAPVSTQGQPNWQVPTGWQPVSAGQFLVAKFMLSGDNGTATAVNVSSSSGDGGGLAPNVNRWRRQLGLPPADEISTLTFAVPDGQAQLVDLSGTNAQSGQPAELVGIVVTQPGQTWFYKLMGDPSLVAAQKDTFTQFVKGVKY